MHCCLGFGASEIRTTNIRRMPIRSLWRGHLSIMSLRPVIWVPRWLVLSNLTDKMKRSFFQAAVVSILLYGCTTWMLTKRLEKNLDGNYTRMLRAILNRSWQQHPTRRQLYGHLPPITKTIQARRTRHAGHCWRSKDEIVSDVLLWTPAYGQSKAGRPARTFIQQLCDDTGCDPEDLPKAMNDRETWRERVRDIRASRTSWWWCYGYTEPWVDCYLCTCHRWDQVFFQERIIFSGPRTYTHKKLLKSLKFLSFNLQ